MIRVNADDTWRECRELVTIRLLSDIGQANYQQSGDPEIEISLAHVYRMCECLEVTLNKENWMEYRTKTKKELCALKVINFNLNFK